MGLGGGIFDVAKAWVDRILGYFNHMGRIWMQIFIIRWVVCESFIEDKFDGGDLKCDTSQVGCEQNCVNRFAPVTQQKLWHFQFMIEIVAIFIFVVASYYNEFRYNAHKAKREKMNMGVNPSKYYVKTRYGKEVILTSMMRNTYILMLFCRLIAEIFFLFLEKELAKHHSQNHSGIEIFQLKEYWKCGTNDHPASEDVLPQTNRSLFYIDDVNRACIQQDVAVTCWIPYSHMKTYGLYFMYGMLIIQTVFTVAELLFEIIRRFTSSGNPIHDPMTSSMMPIVENDKEKLSQA